jgi:hypothetical protein
MRAVSKCGCAAEMQNIRKHGPLSLELAKHLVGQGLVEVGAGLEGRRLIEEPREEIGLGRSAGGRKVRRTHA